MSIVFLPFGVVNQGQQEERGLAIILLVVYFVAPSSLALPACLVVMVLSLVAAWSSGPRLCKVVSLWSTVTVIVVIFRPNIPWVADLAVLLSVIGGLGPTAASFFAGARGRTARVNSSGEQGDDMVEEEVLSTKLAASPA